MTDWKPPETYGLQNSSIIITEYYINKNTKHCINVDYFKIILDDIRNIRKLNDYQLAFIKTLDNEKKQQLFMELNNLFDVIQTLL